MKLVYELNNNDFVINQLYIASKSESINNKRKKERIIIPIIYVVLALYFIVFEDSFIAAAPLLIIAVIWFFAHPIYSKRRYEKHYKNYIAEHYKNRINRVAAIEFTSDFINMKDETGESKINVSEVENLIELKDYFFIKFKTNIYIITPKTKITDIELFKNTIKSYKATYTNEIDWEWK